MKMVIDVDTGVDDAQAIMLALSRPDIELLAITCVAGNCDMQQAYINTRKVLTVCNRTDVPVYKGASLPLLGQSRDARHYHGQDGMGDATEDIHVDLDTGETESSVSALLRFTTEYPGEITLVALAPLTNIALAIRHDPQFGTRLKSVTVMGGNTQGRGNCTLCGEFNFAADPEAALVVLNELRIPIILHTWEINMSVDVGQPWEWFNEWTRVDTPKGRFNGSIVQLAASKQRKINRPIYRSCDMFAMATVVKPSVVMETQDVYATVEVDGKLTRGMMVVDWNRLLNKPSNVQLITALDAVASRALFDEMLL